MHCPKLLWVALCFFVHSTALQLEGSSDPVVPSDSVVQIESDQEDKNPSPRSFRARERAPRHPGAVLRAVLPPHAPSARVRTAPQRHVRQSILSRAKTRDTVINDNVVVRMAERPQNQPLALAGADPRVPSDRVIQAVSGQEDKLRGNAVAATERTAPARRNRQKSRYDPNIEHTTVLTIFGKSTNISSTSTRAGLFTPYGITPGGGEKYFLTAALAFQTMGYEVDILVYFSNVCDTFQKLQATTEAVRVSLNFEKIRLVRVSNDVTFKSLRYDAFFALGNFKMPPIAALGSTINIWMCQFPFDLNATSYDRPIYLNDYDITLVNSRYSQRWYAHFIEPYIEKYIISNESYPSLEILYPPVNSIQTVKVPRKYSNNSTIKIVVLGRFFRGRQSKGHDVALHIIESVVNQSDRKFHLSLIGHIHPTEEALNYVAELKSNASSKGLPVTFITNAKPDQVRAALSAANIMWHLTGMRKDNNEIDPASKEHFGIAIVEAMSAGCIPIVTDTGGPVDIVFHGVNGYLASTEDDYTKYTLEIAAMSKKHMEQKSRAAIERSKFFSLKKFVHRFGLLAHKASMSKGFRNFIQRNLPLLRISGNKLVSKKSPYSAVILETGVNPLFEFAVRNVINFLGHDWGLQVYHSERNEQWIRYTLRDIENVNFKQLPPNMIKYEDYDRVLKNSRFWHSLQSEKVLIFQSDALMLHNRISSFLGFDMVGTTNITERVHVQNISYRFSNLAEHSGFSIRSVKAMIATSDRFSALSPRTEREDIFFVNHLPKLGYKVADPVKTEEFCPSIPQHSLSNDAWRSNPSLATHAPWYFRYSAGEGDVLALHYEKLWLNTTLSVIEHRKDTARGILQ